MTQESSQDPDLLYGVPAIAACLALKVPQARHLYEKGELPCFKIGKMVCSRRSTLNRWLGEREAAGRSSASRPPDRPA